MTLEKSCMIRYHSRSNIQMRTTPVNPSTAILFQSLSRSIRLCLDSTADLSAALAGSETSLGLEGLSLGNLLVGLGEDELDVAGVGHVGVDLNRY
jgi:hypothetical protein